MSTFGVDGLALELVAKISAAPSSSRSFQLDIWLGWMSNCSASCTSVRSPLIAAIATFALKADVWFRRGLLLMLSPDSRAKSCPLSGRSSTYRPVQILEAGSIRFFIKLVNNFDRCVLGNADTIPATHLIAGYKFVQRWHVRQRWPA